MRILTLSLVAAASALAVATPAAAQWYPPQGNAYGYNNAYGQVRSLQVRINNVQRQISMADRRNVITNREAKRLNNEARQLERRLRQVARNGLHPQEARNIELRLARIEQRLFRDARDGRRYGNRYGNQYGNQYGGNVPNWYDANRNGIDDRMEYAYRRN